MGLTYKKSKPHEYTVFIYKTDYTLYSGQESQL
jgi:hypothetical protein